MRLDSAGINFDKKSLRMALHVAKSYNELMAEAKQAEVDQNLEEAAKLYEKAAKLEPHDEPAYDRAMVIYRKLYQYENELRVIESGIRNFETFYKQRTKKIIGRNKVAEQLSKTLAKSLGLTDKKGNELYQPAPIEKWLKRKAVVEKKLGKTVPKKTKSTSTKKSAKRK